MTINKRNVTLHGHTMNFWEYRPAVRSAESDGDVLVFVHGIAGSARTWLPLLHELDRRGVARRVIVPDLLGHGESATPRGDYSLGAFASAIRDLLVLLGLRHATVAGHSLGGGVAMQFAYQYPEMCGRLVLISSGGLGKEVSGVLRATAIPGTKAVLALLVNRATLATGHAAAAALGRALGGRLDTESRELVAHLASLADPGRRTAFLSTVRGLLDLRGQRVSAHDRLYLSAAVPTLIVWGARDWMIPARHGREAAGLMPGSRIEVLPMARHFPHAAEPAHVATILNAFLNETEPARLNLEELAAVLLAGGQATVQHSG
ncbi:Pimeloyl-ACP methyl ester carboxylesterase [Amycolatopsis marina]|uniref:Pimeloyl-ACP methyl ester carboxylesterase n=1 Tax=Amycolatopsis marina TaxID=490629 RepID=A0A1I1CKA9_9PSEU|nr:alpha/beta fold hydrolase [Amycolatopsis marina]SFB62917.1 Pimeloyl-ACP methyl ester carboxylesterase [Amycolatopsis marina]